MTLEAEDRLERGIADRTLVRKAIELDSDNDRAEKLSARFAKPDPVDGRASTRFTAAITIGLVSLLGMAWVLFRRSAPEPKAEEPEPDQKKPEPEAPAESASSADPGVASAPEPTAEAPERNPD